VLAKDLAQLLCKCAAWRYKRNFVGHSQRTCKTRTCSMFFGW
jgi:hypothetical protein